MGASRHQFTHLLQSGSSQVSEDFCDLLERRILPFAEQCLHKDGGFDPFGAAIDGESVLHANARYDDTNVDQFDSLVRARSKRYMASGRYRASAVAWDCSMVPPGSERSDVIAVHLESSEGDSLGYFLPYKLAGNEVTFGDPFGWRMEPRDSMA